MPEHRCAAIECVTILVDQNSGKLAGALAAPVELDTGSALLETQLERVREMERRGELEPIPEVSATIQ